MTRRQMYIMQGIPGSGKSTVAAQIHDAAFMKGVTVVTLSTDHFWGPDYDFDPTKHVEAHEWNQRRCLTAAQDGASVIIIDNTNIEKVHAQPYILLAGMFGYDVQVVSIQVDVGVAKRRNALRPENRRIPDEVIESMHKRLERLL